MNNEIMHYGVLGMKWGVRRYQNKDGSLTRLGKKHKKAVLKGLEDGIDQYTQIAKQSKEAAEINRKALEKTKNIVNKTDKDHWNDARLKEAYIYFGRQYIDNTVSSRLYSEYLKNYSNDTIKLGEDYVVKNLKTGKISLTDSGRAKEAAIVDRVMNEIKKEYANEIKEYS